VPWAWCRFDLDFDLDVDLDFDFDLDFDEWLNLVPLRGGSPPPC
jgi:hypothetical protein